MQEKQPPAHKGYQKQVKKAQPAPIKKQASADYASPLAKKWPAFIEAIQSGNDDAVKRLMEEGINVNLSRGGVTPLMAAVSSGRVETATLLLEAGANVNEKNEEGWTALHRAAGEQSGAAVIELLLAFGADPEAKDRTGKTALAVAEEKKHAEVVRAIRKHQDRRTADAREWAEFLNSAEGAPYRAKHQLDVLEPYSRLWWVPIAGLGLAGLAASPLFGVITSLCGGLVLGALVIGGVRLRMLALAMRLDQYEPLPDLDIVLLRQKRAAGEPIGVVKRGKVPEEAAEHPVTPAPPPVATVPAGDSLPVPEEPEDGDILAEPASVPPVRSRAQKKVEIRNVVIPAVAIVLAALVAALAFYRVPISRRYYALKLQRTGTPFTSAAFLTAVADNDAAAVDLFVKAGATGEERNEKGQTALIIAAERGHDAILRRLLALNPGMIGQQDAAGMTPLMTAALRGQEAAVRVLVEQHAAVNQEAAGREGAATALQAVLDAPDFTEAHMRILLYLLENGADVRRKNAAGESPLHFAASQGLLDAAKLLCGKGADVRDADNAGETAIYVAACQDDPDLIAYFQQQGADVNGSTADGETPLMCAAREDNAASVSLLIEKGAAVDSRSPRGWTALTEASAAGNAGVAKLLLDKGADPSAGYVPEAYRALNGKPVSISAAKKTIGDALRRLAAAAAQDGYTVRYQEPAPRKTTVNAKGPWNAVLTQIGIREHLFPLFREKEIQLIPYVPLSRPGGN